MTKEQITLPFVKYHTGLSYLFSPAESRFILHMLDFEFMRSNGYDVDWSRGEYMKRMGLNQYTFDKCIKRLEELDLLSRKYNRLGNRVYLKFNLPLYNKLVTILSATINIDEVIIFCERNFKVNKRSIESITEEEINNLRSSGSIKKRLSFNKQE